MLSRLAAAVYHFVWPTSHPAPSSPTTTETPAVSPMSSDADTNSIKPDQLQSKLTVLDDLSDKFLAEIKTWEKLRDDLNAMDTKAEDAQINLQSALPAMNESLVKRIKDILKGLVESPDLYLREHLQPCCNEVKKLASHYDELLAVVEKQPLPASRPAALEICDTSIKIFNLFVEMIKTTQEEVNYCLGVDRVGERILQGVVMYAVCQVPPYAGVTGLTVTLEPMYRDALYKKIHEELDQLSTFMTSVGNAVNNGKRVCTPVVNASLLTASTVFVAPVQPSVAETPEVVRLTH